MRAPLAAAVLVSLALTVAACGDDDERGSFTSETGTGTETTGTTDTTGTTGTTETNETTETTGTKTTPSKTPAGNVSKTFRIGETEFKLQPASFELAKPGVVVFVVKNTGQIAHALEVEGPTGEFETGSIEPGQTVRLRADVSKAGTYELYCPIGNHEAQGMVGDLVVAGRTGGAAAPTNGHGGDAEAERQEDERRGDDGGGTSDGSGSGGRDRDAEAERQKDERHDGNGGSGY